MALPIKENIPLSSYTIYRIGGPAQFFVKVKNSEELEEALMFAAKKGLPFFILGAGSNVLASDKGFAGLVVKLENGNIKINEEKLVVDAGVMMAKAVLISAKAGLTGFEWGIGVPGTVGGSVRGNAGCFAGEMSQVLESVQVLDTRNLGKSDLQILNSECQFTYRDSIFKRHPEWVILSATLKLKKGDPAKVQNEVRRIVIERGQKQDIGTKTCGCIFKNIVWEKIGGSKEKMMERFPEFKKFQDSPNVPASFLLDKAGLRGKRIGRVYISPKHANFFVNEGGASADEVRQLTQLAKEEVKKKYGLGLEEEIVYLGF